jgi:hypothetical protein
VTWKHFNYEMFKPTHGLDYTKFSVAGLAHWNTWGWPSAVETCYVKSQMMKVNSCITGGNCMENYVVMQQDA